MTSRAAAEILGILPKAVNHLVNRGRLTGVLTGAVWNIDPESVQAFADYNALKSAMGLKRAGRKRKELDIPSVKG